MFLVYVFREHPVYFGQVLGGPQTVLDAVTGVKHRIGENLFDIVWGSDSNFFNLLRHNHTDD